MNIILLSEIKFASWRNYLKKTITIGTLILITSSCGFFKPSDNQSVDQQKLLSELQQNQQKWNQAGVTQYSFSLEKECDCPDEYKKPIVIAFDDEVDSEDLDNVDQQSLSKAIGKSGTATRKQKTSGRAFSPDSQTTRMETVFADLRQGILDNSVRQVTFNPVYGYPQTVTLNTLPQFVGASISSNPVTPFTFQTRDFRVLNTTNTPSYQTLSGQFVIQNSTGGTNYWLVDNSGNWNQLQVSANLYTSIQSISDQSYVQVSGLWTPGGISGNGMINVQSITPLQASAIPNNLYGTLNYDVTSGNNANVYNFYVNSDNNRNIALNVPSDLQTQAFLLAGQRVGFDGNWTTSASDVNAQFNLNGFNPILNPLVRLNGTLNFGATLLVPGIQGAQYILVNDFGVVVELQIPQRLNSAFTFLVGQRVDVLGVLIYSGVYGQAVVRVQSITPVQNIYTNTQISGVIVDLLPSATGLYDLYRLRLDTGNTIMLSIPARFRNPSALLSPGVRVSVTGVWSDATATNFEARAPIQILNPGQNTNNTYTGYITNVGTIGNTNCSAQPTTFGFVSDNGESLQLVVTNTTQVTGISSLANITIQMRVEVSGFMSYPGVLTAQSINVVSQNETTISGTIVGIGPVGDTFTCAGPIYLYQVRDNNGNLISVQVTSNTVNQGARLQIGETIQATGKLSIDGRSLVANRIVGSTIPPIGNVSTFTGIVTGLDCQSGFNTSYLFVDNNGTLYRLRTAQGTQLPAAQIGVGSSLQVTGTISNNELIATQIIQLQTFADPINRTPFTGIVLNVMNNSPSNCGASVYTYQFQNSNGQIQQLRVDDRSTQTFGGMIPPGTRITVLAWIQSTTNPIVDAITIQTTQGIAGTSVVGTVTLVNTCPGPIGPGANCAQPFANATVNLFDSTNRIAATALTNASGYYQTTVTPGFYIARVATGAVLPRCTDVNVSVITNQSATANIQCDTGIR